MRTRKLAELYAIAVDNINLLDAGLCKLFSELYVSDLINEKEWEKLRKHFHKCKPSLNKKYKCFTLHEMWEDHVFWWRIGEKEIRKQFLIRLREDTKPWYDKIWWI